MIPSRSFFPSRRASLFAATALLSLSAALGQTTPPPAPGQTPAPDTTTLPGGIQGTTQTTTTTSTAMDGSGKQTQSTNVTTTFSRGKKKDEKVRQSKDTRKAMNKEKKADALVGIDSKLPDKMLYDKAFAAIKKGHYDVARLDLQTMLNTYPDSQYQMRAKLAIADSWYKEGGTAALTQAESEYADFRVFFPNAPEAAEAQMRIGDIYFRQMDRPDRDYSKAIHSEEEYRRMLTDYPDSTLVPQAKQRLRDVQEVLASREADIASFYATHENWAAVIARYQTVVDTYPLFSHMDDTLVGLGDAFEAQARYVRTLKLPEGPRAQLEGLYNKEAADAYRKVVLEHSASAHVEDARDRLAAMNLPIPEPTAAQVAASQALENSRRTYGLSDHLRLLIMHAPDTVLAAGQGEPMMVDPRPTVAPTITRRAAQEFNEAFNNKPTSTAPVLGASQPDTAPAPTQPATSVAPAAPLTLNDVGTVDAAPAGNGGAVNMTPPATGGGNTNTLGFEIVTPLKKGTAADTTGGLAPVGGNNAKALPPIEKPAESPDRQNEVTTPQPAAQVAKAKGKKPKPAFDKSEDSSNKHKKKKGIAKVNPF